MAMALLRICAVACLGASLSGCLVSSAPTIPRNQLLKIGALEGQFIVKSYDKKKGYKTTGKVLVTRSRDLIYAARFQSDKSDGSKSKPVIHKFRVTRFATQNHYLIILDKGWGGKSLYAVLKRERDGGWLLQLLTIKVEKSKKTNPRAVEIAVKHGVALSVKSNSALDHTITSPVTLSRLQRLFSDRQFMNEVGLQPYYKFYPLRKTAPRPTARSDSRAMTRCGALPRSYAKREYGGVLYSLRKPCIRTFSHKEQLFVAGLSQQLLSKCGFPKNIRSRLKLQKFLSSSVMVGVIGRQYSDPNLGKGLGDQSKSMAAYTMGGVAFKNIGCTRAGQIIARSVVKYLDRTSSGRAGSRYVSGCARYYRGRYTHKQCQCIANIGRSVYPSIHQSSFSPRSIKNIIKSNPLVGLQIATQCRIGNY